jgi:hypothetical protein
MQVKTGEHLCPEAAAVAEPIEDLLYHDYYTRTPRIRLRAENASGGEAVEVLLDGGDVAGLVACAIRHPSLNMRHAVLTAMWNHPESFREILRFGLQAPEAFADIRKVVAEELGKPTAADAAPTEPRRKALLPKLPLPPHLRDRGKE